MPNSFRILLMLFVSVFSSASLVGQNKNLYDEANKLYAAQKYVEAISIYRKMLDAASEPNEKAKIIFNIGISYVHLKFYDEADREFHKILSMKVNNREPSEKNKLIYRNYHHGAQMEIARIHYAKGEFEKALQSFRNARGKYPYESGCGKCISDEDDKISLYEAAALEYLNKNREAFSIYLKITHPRIIEIYAANDQLDKLIETINKKNELIILERMQKYSWTREKASEYLPAKNFGEYFKAYKLGKAGDVTTLMELLREHAGTPGDGYLKDWTARMIALNPPSAVALVSAELRNLKTYPYLYYRTLGFTGTPEAVALLKDYARKTNGWFDATAIVSALSLAGKDGEAALRELEQAKISENTRLALKKYRSGELLVRNYEEIEFPPMPSGTLFGDLSD